MQSNARRHTSTKSLSGMSRKNGRTASRNSEWPTTTGRGCTLHAGHGPRTAAKRMKFQFAGREEDPAGSSSACSSDAITGGNAALAGNVFVGSVPQDAAQDPVMSCRADGRRTSPREGQDDEERAKRQGTEKKTERIGDGSVKCGEG